MIENTKTGETFEDDANVLVAARGALNEIAWPQIPGFKSFSGEVMHSAAWNEKYERLASLNNRYTDIVSDTILKTSG